MLLYKEGAKINRGKISLFLNIYTWTSAHLQSIHHWPQSTLNDACIVWNIL